MIHAVARSPSGETPVETRWDDQEETDLVLRAKDDPTAFARLYLIHVDRLYRFLRTRTNTTEDAEDLAQQVFLKAFQALPRFEGSGASFIAWLFRIARNETANWYRSKHPTSTPWQELAAQGIELPSTDEGPESAAIRAERLRGLVKLLATLSREQQELLQLRYAADLPIRRIAEILDISDVATRQRLHRTLSRLKEAAHDSSIS